MGIFQNLARKYTDFLFCLFFCFCLFCFVLFFTFTSNSHWLLWWLTSFFSKPFLLLKHSNWPNRYLTVTKSTRQSFACIIWFGNHTFHLSTSYTKCKYWLIFTLFSSNHLQPPYYSVSHEVSTLCLLPCPLSYVLSLVFIDITILARWRGVLTLKRGTGTCGP